MTRWGFLVAACLVLAACGDAEDDVFGDGECYCLPDCGQAGLSEGEACTDDGSVECTRIVNASGDSNGVFCVPAEWGLCG